jgi:recombination protein RecA
MRAALSKAEIETEIASRFGDAFKLHEKGPAEVLSSGISQIDSFTGGGLPRGAITEIFGPSSSGRTSFMLSALAHATSHDEVCALVDTSNVFDPSSASHAEINLERLLWIRCAHNLEHAFKATDLLLQGGGFGLVMLDLADVPTKDARRIISSWWYRFRRTLESTPTVLVVIAEESCAKSCAALALELKQQEGYWAGDSGASKVSEFPAARSGLREGPRRGPQRSLKKDVRTSSFESPNSRMNSVPLPHANLLRGLHFQIECQRPLHLTRRSEELLVKAAR